LNPPLFKLAAAGHPFLSSSHDYSLLQGHAGPWHWQPLIIFSDPPFDNTPYPAYDLLTTTEYVVDESTARR
jgi:hypothetical protein